MSRTRTFAFAMALTSAALLGCSALSYDEPGTGQDKVVVCHKGKKTLEVAAPALDAHLRHGDARGPCR